MFFSAMSDLFGRKPVFLFSEWAMVVVGIITAFVGNYYLFCVLRFFAGALQQVSHGHHTLRVQLVVCHAVVIITSATTGSVCTQAAFMLDSGRFTLQTKTDMELP